MSRPKARKRTPNSSDSRPAAGARNDAGLLDLALSMNDGNDDLDTESVDSPNPSDLVLLGEESEENAVDPDHVFGLPGERSASSERAASAELDDDSEEWLLDDLFDEDDDSAESAAAPAPAPVAASAPVASAPLAPPPSPSPSDVAGGLVAEMQNRFAELQAWADSTTQELNARREQLDELEASLGRRREEIAAQEQKTAHERERFARYRAAELETLAELKASAEREASETLAQAEVDARILRETATSEGVELAEELQREAREAIESLAAEAEAERATRQAEFEATLAREQEKLDAEAANLHREQKRMSEASAEVAALREELDGEWQSVLRLQRSAESLAKAWEAESERRRVNTGLRLGSGDVTLISNEAEDGPNDHVRLAA